MVVFPGLPAGFPPRPYFRVSVLVAMFLSTNLLVPQTAAPDPGYTRAYAPGGLPPPRGGGLSDTIEMPTWPEKGPAFLSVGFLNWLVSVGPKTMYSNSKCFVNYIFKEPDFLALERPGPSAQAVRDRFLVHRRPLKHTCCGTLITIRSVGVLGPRLYADGGRQRMYHY